MGVIKTQSYVLPSSFVRGQTRNIGYLADGTAIAALLCDYTGTMASANVRLFYSTNDGDTWVEFDDFTAANATLLSMSIDSSDNIHCIYTENDSIFKLHYRKLTVSGSLTWTLGAEEDIASLSGANEIQYADIDVTDDDIPVVIWCEGYWITSPTNTAKVKARGASWATVGVDIPSIYWMPRISTLSVSRNAGGAVSGTEKISIALCKNKNDVELYTLDLNTSTKTLSALTSIARVALNLDNDNMLKTLSGMLFPTATNEWMLFGQSTPPVGSDGRPPAFMISYSNTSIIKTAKTNSMFDAAYQSSGESPVGAYGITTLDNPIAVGGDGSYGYSSSRVGRGVVSLNKANPTASFNKKAFGSPVDAFYWDFAGATRNLPNYFMWISLANATSRAYRSYKTSVGATPAVMTFPGEGSVVQTSEPTLTGQGPGATASTTGNVAGRFEVASDAGFTTDLLEIDSNGTNLFSVAVPLADALDQGTWYARVWVRDLITDQIGAASDAVEFTIAHQPSASITFPSASGIVPWATNIPVSWNFTDPWGNDHQTAYQIILEKNSDGTSLYNSGKVTSSSKTAVMPVSIGDVNIDLRVKVTVWDAHDVASVASEYRFFQVTEPPIIAITSPLDNAVLDNPNPTFEWTFTPSGAAQESFKFDFYIGGTAVHSTPWVTSDLTFYSLQGNFLTDATGYEVVLSVKDLNGVIGSDGIAFTTAWDKPSGILASVIAGEDSLEVSWSNTGIDPEFHSWRVYRRSLGDTVWTMVYENFNNQSGYIFEDFSVPITVDVEYAVVQVAIRFGALIESEYIPQPGVLYSEKYWLIHPTDSSLNMVLHHVSEESFSDNYEQESFNLLGRGMHTDFGDRLGYSGSITAQLTDKEGIATAREQRLHLELLRELRIPVYFRNPFGDIWKVSLDNMEFSRIPGVGLHEASTVTIPYQEVTE